MTHVVVIGGGGAVLRVQGADRLNGSGIMEALVDRLTGWRRHLQAEMDELGLFVTR